MTVYRSVPETSQLTPFQVERISKLAEEGGYTPEELIGLLEKRPDQVREQIASIREETRKLADHIKLLL